MSDRVLGLVSFQELAGLAFSKKTWNGLMVRRRLLRGAGIEVPDGLSQRAGAASPDDVLDAAVAAWTARRFLRGEAMVLPKGTPTSGVRPTGLIWY